jgi:hypothetical protein
VRRHCCDLIVLVCWVLVASGTSLLSDGLGEDLLE